MYSFTCDIVLLIRSSGYLNTSFEFWVDLDVFIFLVNLVVGYYDLFELLQNVGFGFDLNAKLCL